MSMILAGDIGGTNQVVSGRGMHLRRSVRSE